MSSDPPPSNVMSARVIQQLQQQVQQLERENHALRSAKRVRRAALTSPSLNELGYCYCPGHSGQASDWVLRQTADTDKGFEWKGQEDYDKLGAAVLDCLRREMTKLCGLEALPVPANPTSAHHGFVYATHGLRSRMQPLLLLICSSELVKGKC